MSVRTLYLLTVAFCSFLSMGCGGGQAKVEGVVTLDGTPVPGATVTFTPTEGSAVPGLGVTDAGGEFRIESGGKNGLPSGTYKVTVIKEEAPQGSAPVVLGSQKPPEGGKSMPGMAEMMKSAKLDPTKMKPGAMPKPAKAALPKGLLPSKYASVGSTPFTISVPTDGKVKLELKSKD
jgi:hypothetical protein